MTEISEEFLQEFMRQLKNCNIMRYAEIQLKILESRLDDNSKQKMITDLNKLMLQ